MTQLNTFGQARLVTALSSRCKGQRALLAGLCRGGPLGKDFLEERKDIPLPYRETFGRKLLCSNVRIPVRGKCFGAVEPSLGFEFCAENFDRRQRALILALN